MKIACALVLAFVSTTVAYADSLVTVRPVGSDSVDWSQLGGVYADIPQTFNFTTANSVAGTGVLAGGDGSVRFENDGWGGNFAVGDPLVYTQGYGPLTLTFASGYTQIGAQIQGNYYGGFTAEICDSVSCFTEDGTSNGNNDGSAIYIGISSATPITSVTFSLSDAPYGSTGDFAIDGLTLGAAHAGAFEPGAAGYRAAGRDGYGAASHLPLVTEGSLPVPKGVLGRTPFSFCLTPSFRGRLSGDRGH